MGDLIKKDFIASWIILAGMLFMVPFITTLATLAMTEDFGGIVIGVFALITIILSLLSTFISLGMESSTNAEMTYASLPITRAAIVCARYLSAALFILLNFSLIVVTSLISVHVINVVDPVLTSLFTVRGFICVFSFLLLLLSLLLPFYFKFGAGRGVTAGLLFQIGIVLLVPVIKFIINLFSGIIHLDLNSIIRFLYSSLSWIFGLRPVFAYLFAIGTIAVILLLSAALSVRFYNRRDL